MVIKDTIRIGSKLYFYVPILYYGPDTVAVDTSGNLVYFYQGKDELFYKFSANVGETWETTLPFSNYQPRRFEVTLKSRSDTIRTRAGIFANCLQFYFRAPGTSGEFTHWLAPNVGLVVRCTPIPSDLYEAEINGVKYPITSVEDDPPLVQDFELKQNYPNPFNPGTMIEFTVTTSGRCVLKVFDVSGKEVNTLYDKVSHPGKYHITWDGRGADGKLLPSGSYFYQLSLNDKLTSKKLILLR